MFPQLMVNLREKEVDLNQSVGQFREQSRQMQSEAFGR